MNPKTKLTIFLIACLFILEGALNFSVADSDGHKEKSGFDKIMEWDDDDGENHRHRKRNRKRHRNYEHRGSYLTPVNNPTYKEACGVCHFVYQPELLPSASWMKILDQLDDHFGEEIELDHDSRIIITDYLNANGAEKSTAIQAVKIMQSLGSHIIMRITDIPYIREKHHELNPEVLKRESIGSLSNCIACHTKAEEGIYEDDDVNIPKQSSRNIYRD